MYFFLHISLFLQNKNTQKLCELTLFAQYASAIKFAKRLGCCNLYLIPLGLSSFKNEYSWVKKSILNASNFINAPNVSIKLLDNS